MVIGPINVKLVDLKDIGKGYIELHLSEIGIGNFIHPKVKLKLSFDQVTPNQVTKLNKCKGRVLKLFLQE